MRLRSVVISALLLLPLASVYAQSRKPADLVGAWLGTYDSLIVQPDSTFVWRLLGGATRQRFTRRLQAMKGDTIIFASAIRPDSYLVFLPDCAEPEACRCCRAEALNGVWLRLLVEP